MQFRLETRPSQYGVKSVWSDPEIAESIIVVAAPEILQQIAIISGVLVTNETTVMKPKGKRHPQLDLWIVKD